ncbi:vitamin B12 dependent-methionine synthase activation domain-containing protein [Candidatus Latescibacterota bacterium]
MVDSQILDNMLFDIDVDKLRKKLHVGEGTDDADALNRLVHRALSIGKPKAMYRIANIDSRGGDYVVVDGKTFTSRVLKVNLKHAHRVFCYTVTCGTELEEWSESITDMVENFWVDSIKEIALRNAYDILAEHLNEKYDLGKTSTMSPGSLEDWPLKEQRILFTILGNTKDAIGLELTDSLLMVPTKSVSGIRFATEENFESCLLCQREGCQGRRAKYDKDLYDHKYRAK